MLPSPLRGAVSYALVAALAAAAGAAITWFLTGHRPRSLDAVTTHGEWVQVHRGNDSIRTYVAYPERKDKAPAVLVIHEIYGLTDWEPTVADRLAKAGYVAAVPDLLSREHGQTPGDAGQARQLIGQLDPDSITADLDAVAGYLNGLPAVRSGDLGVIGFCWGGGQSFRYATNNPDLKAAVVCYGPPPGDAALARIQAPVLGVYGEADARIGATVPATDSAMRALGKPYRHHTYPGTGHGFLKPGRRGSDSDQVGKAWEDILQFFGTHL